MRKPMATMNATDAVFCGQAVDSLVVAGCGDGNLLAFNLRKGGDCLYGFGADDVGAVHCMQVAPDRKSLVTGGDAG